ncbi:DNA photolyase family protein [Myxococcota bacterium]|nr:DNA photolyase family protein [Myxococcota bacterium]MBU1383114.1 DNA photolyase family protein [Myxococcota bacterium]MBU1499063.1 DNA photolyase family protein [Myxococcota bacterium]
MKINLFIFHRDLRIFENNALERAINDDLPLCPCFFFDRAQLENNRFFSSRAFSFMIESLKDLDRDLAQHGGRLHLFYGSPGEILAQILSSGLVNTVYSGFDYTPFAKNRDATLTEICKTHGLEHQQFHNLLIKHPNAVLKKDGTPYTVFTPYFKKWLLTPIELPLQASHRQFSKICLPGELTWEQIENLDPVRINFKSYNSGGRKAGLSLLSRLQSISSDYENLRNIPALNATSGLSPHLKAGTVSPVEAYQILLSCPGGASLIRELAWRDFFSSIAYHFPRVFSGAFREEYNLIEWPDSDDLFSAWCEGKTGFPLIDAAMRQLNDTGWMHGRLRMVAASFLVKDLHVDWHRGEQYFASKLVDYDPAVNNGNWQWCASTGCDAQPWFRIFNPLLQQKKYDPDCRFIKKFVPELKRVDCATIHSYETKRICADYPAPIVSHSQASAKIKQIYKSLKYSNSSMLEL